MGRARKAGLTYYYKDAHEWDDYRIIDLLETFGPVGYTVYDVIRSEVYKNGYYLEIPLEKLSLLVMRAVGNRWIEDKSQVMRIVEYCGEIGLFDRNFLSQSVITSEEIQTHYDDVTARRKADKIKYWLLGSTEAEKTESDNSDAHTDISAAKTDDLTAET